MEKTNLTCDTCMEPTKVITTFCDGYFANKAVHGHLYTCKNTECPIHKAELQHSQEEAERINAVKEAHTKQNISIKHLKAMRIDKHLYIFDMASALNISSATYSKYELEKEIMPKNLYEKALSFLNAK